MKTINKLLVVIMAIFTITQLSYGQISFSHSIGGSYYMCSSTAAPGIMYSPRLNLIELDDEMTISIGTHFGLGFALNSREGASSLALDIPLVAEFNFGHAANPDTRSSFGGFAGLGFGINKIGSAGVYGTGYNNAAGIVINAGIRALIKERALGLRLSYLLNMKTGFENVFSIGAFYTFGDF
jgi:hypothetical protein